jgi:uncharacterized protein
MSHDADDADTNPSNNAHLEDIVAERLRGTSRRSVLRGGLGLGLWGLMGGGASLLGACGDNIDPMNPEPEPEPEPMPQPRPTRPAALGFAAVAKSLDDVVSLPAGYSYSVLYGLGDPIADGVSAYANDGTDAAATFAQRAGDHHDGMHFFGLSASGGYGATASDRGLLCLNHEAITSLFLHPTGQTVTAGARTVAEEVEREFYLHGVSVIEVNRSAAGAWSYKQNSMFNRRVHTLTEMEISGPLRGNAAMITKFSPTGVRTRGTVNNCANGYTPWGTYLTCEENWAGYFRRVVATDNPSRSAKEVTSFTRYGVAGNGRELWATVTPDTADERYGRWNTMVTGADAAADYRNVSNTYGWIVEIDPFNPTSTPKKRTAMGRFAHEGAWIAEPITGKPLVIYSGDDSRGEYIYKYVSDAKWDPADANRTDRTAVGDKYFDSGKLYVAKFNADGTGTWLEIAFGKNNITAANPAYSFADQADVALNSRLAADAAGATKMDRPEWGAVDPVTGAVYMTLTNNLATVRTLAATDAANPRHYNDPKTVGGVTTNLYGNPNGHIIRWKESSPEETSFFWDIFLFGAAADASPTDVNLSALTGDNDFSSPDGLWFSAKTNICWIETDDGAFTDVTNCMLLAALPGSVGDGARKTVTNIDQAGMSKQVSTPVGAQPADKLRRFLVGPKQCEITGITETPDGKALFVNIQHPGEDTPAASLATPVSTWPSTVAGTRPRSATIIITRNDGGVIGIV